MKPSLVKVKEIGSRIKQKRKERKLTSTVIQEKTGVAQSTLSDIERGIKPPSINTLLQLSSILECTTDWILTGKNSTLDDEDSDSNGITLPQLERDLIAMFRLLPTSTQKEIFDLIHYKYTRLSGGEKESIFWTYFDEEKNQKEEAIPDSQSKIG